MRIALDFRLAQYGGIGTYVRTLLEGLASRSDCEVVAFGPAAHRTLMPADAGEPVKYLEFTTPAFSVREQLAVPRLLTELKVDLVHSPYYNFCLWTALPTVVTVHDLVWFHPEYAGRWRPAVVYSRYMIRQAFRRADVVVTVSQTSRAEFERLGLARVGKVHVTEMALSPSLSRELGKLTDERREADGILYVGTFKRSKHVDVLLAALSLLRADGHRVRAVLAGAPARHWNVDVQGLVAALALDDAVELRGPVSETQLARLYHGAQVYVMPSEYEGFGSTTLEAMAAGCPVVAADLPVHHEVAGDAARYFRPSNAEDLARVLGEVLGNPSLREAMARRGLQRASGFALARLAEQTMHAYRSALAEAASSRDPVR